MAEPYLESKRYAAFLLGVSFASLVLADALSLVHSTPGARAGPSGGIYGLWAYLGIRTYSGTIGEAWGSLELAIDYLGLIVILIVPAWGLYSDSILNVSHVIGILLGYAVALVELHLEADS